MPKVYDPILCMMVDKSATRTTDAKGGKLAKKVNDASYPAEVYKMQNEVARVKKIDKNHISIRKLSNDKYEFSNRLGDPLAVYNDKAGTLMMYDSKSALDKAIKTVDGATGDKLYADVKAIYNLFSSILLTYSNEQSVQKLANEGTKKCLELAAKVKGVRDEATRTTDAANLKGLKDDYGRLKNASSIIGNIYSLSSSTKSAILKAIESGMREIDTRIDRAYMK